MSQVAVVIPCFNYGQYLAEAIESVLVQTAPPAEILVVDDASTDETPEVASRYAPRASYFRQENAGLSAVRNRGIRQTQSPYLVFLDADDIMLPDNLAALLEVSRRFPDASVVFGCSSPFEHGTGRQVPHPPSRLERIESIPHRRHEGNVYEFTGSVCPAMLRGSFVPMCSALIKRAVFDEGIWFDEQNRGVEDRDFWFWLARVHKMVYVHRELSRVRYHGVNFSRTGSSTRRFDGLCRFFERVLAQCPELSAQDRAYAESEMGRLCRSLIRHHLAGGDGMKARQAWHQLRQATGRAPSALYLASLVPGPLLRLAGSTRRLMHGKSVGA